MINSQDANISGVQTILIDQVVVLSDFPLQIEWQP